MSILYILDFFKPNVGGIEVLFDNITSKLVEQGHSVKILTFRFDQNLPEHEKHQSGIEIYRIGKNKLDFMWKIISFGRRLLDGVDIIHTSNYLSAIPARILGWLGKKKTMITINGFFGKYWMRFFGNRGRKFRILEWLIGHAKFDAYVCVSSYIKNAMRTHFGIQDNKLIRIYNGIDYKIWNKENFIDVDKIRLKHDLNDKFVLLYFGRAEPIKGLDYLLNSMNEIKSKIKNVRLVLVLSDYNETNPDIQNIKKIISENKLENYIIWIGKVENTYLGNYILASDVVINPSLGESFGYAALEVCLLNKQLVVSDIAALPEVVYGKINFSVPADSKSIAQGVLNFYNGKYQNISEKTFLREENIKLHLELYESLVNT